MRNRAFEYLLLLVVLAITILFAIKPWRVHFFDGLAKHWDTRLMGEWMAWNAHNILNGRFWAPDYHANFFYPHSYTLAFSELLWPQSFLYALLYRFSGNLFFSFNGVMLFFWALSGVVMFALLRTFNISRPTSYLGSFIYCLMPYRLAYYVEFNMVLVFILPLMFLLMIFWLRDYSIKSAIWFCIGLILSATSCIYFTIMAVIAIVFIFIAYAANTRTLFRNKKFYLSLSAMVVGVSIGCVLYLYPYYILRTQGGYQRTNADYLWHHGQPMHYLNTSSASLVRKWISPPPCRFSETHLFPGTVLAVLTLSYIIYDIIRYFSKRLYLKPIGVTGPLKAILWFLFWGVIIYHAVYGKATWLNPYSYLLYWISFGLIVLYSFSLIFPAETTESRLLLTGLSAAAVLCFFISLGPLITVGPDAHRMDISRGPFADINVIPLFGAVRGITRFSIVVLTYFVIASCFTIDHFLKRTPWLKWLFPILIGVLIYEAQDLRYNYKQYSSLIKSSTIQKCQNIGGDYTLFLLPAAIRDIDPNLVMFSIGSFPLLVNGVSGFTPTYYKDYFYWEKTGWKIDKITSRLQEIWPPVYILVDNSWLKLMERGWHYPFPWEAFKEKWRMIYNDQYNRFLLFKQRDHTFDLNEKIVRRIRTDLLRENPILSFMARCVAAEGGLVVEILLNGQPVAERFLTEEWKKNEISLPSNGMGDIQGETVEIRLKKPSSGCQIREIEFNALKSK